MATKNAQILNLVAVAAEADNEYCSMEAKVAKAEDRVAELEAENAMLKKMLEPEPDADVPDKKHGKTA